MKKYSKDSYSFPIQKAHSISRFSGTDLSMGLWAFSSSSSSSSSGSGDGSSISNNNNNNYYYYDYYSYFCTPTLFCVIFVWCSQFNIFFFISYAIFLVCSESPAS
jgi:hypothetical protein